MKRHFPPYFVYHIVEADAEEVNTRYKDYWIGEMPKSPQVLRKVPFMKEFAKRQIFTSSKIKFSIRSARSF